MKKASVDSFFMRKRKQMKAVKKGLPLILSPNFFCENEYDVIIKSYIHAHHNKADLLVHIMMCSDVRLYDTMIFVFIREVRV